MKVCFNRTYSDIFNYSYEDYYREFFNKYEIDLDNDNYIYLFGENKGDLIPSITYFFSKGRIIVFDAKLWFYGGIPYNGYAISIYKQSDIKSINIETNGEYYNENYCINIDFGFTSIEIKCDNGKYKTNELNEIIKLFSQIMEGNTCTCSQGEKND